MVDEKDFFREVTLRVCGNPEIEKALRDCLLYIRNNIPADEIFLNVYNRGTGTAEVLVWADIHRGEFISFKATFPRDVARLIEDAIRRGDTDVLVADHIRENPILAPLAVLTKKPEAAAMFIRSKPSWGMLGGIGIVNYGSATYTEDHVRLFSLLNEPFGIAFVNYMRYREVLRLKDILADDNRYLQDELRRQAGEEVVGGNFGLKPVMDLARQVAPLSSPVLLLGETGTGKEVISTAIHNLSPRRNGPFIKVNCGAIPASLMDSELFGHEKGAFTGALAQKRGRFERAHGGTIFLDEIGELTPEAQVRLLRVIQEKTIERVGGTEEIPLDIRIIAATHRKLEAMMREGRFREDLYFRLQVFPITIPPLRKRPGDIPALVQYFITKEARAMALAEIPTIAPEAIERLMAYPWPGNVRELQNVVERALILSKGQPLIFEDLRRPETEAGYSAPGSNQGRGDLMDLDDVISNHIRKALATAEGRIEGEQGAARLLNMNPSTLRSKMRKLKIPFGHTKQEKDEIKRINWA
jgi:transcriptional regulator with GAF, ATPase, and Fis domain